MLSETLLKLFNEQMTKELYSSYLYLQMRAWFDQQTLLGFANWMKVQAQEEMAHMEIFYQYVNEQGGHVELGAIEKPPFSYDSPVDVFDKVLKHEKLVTASIHNMMHVAVEEKDYASQSRLQWFIDEQVEEESTAQEWLTKLQRIGKDSAALYVVDQELSVRTFVIPTPLKDNKGV